MAIPLRAGRDFSERDTEASEKVILLNEKAARALFSTEDPVGQIVRFDTDRRIVGVVGNVRHLALEQEGGNEAYIPVSQAGSDTVDLVVRSSVPPETLIPAVRRALAAVDSAMPTSEFQQLGDLVDRAVSPRRFITWLLGAFACSALVLAVVGIYGVVSYSVSQRMQEIGIRMALGASPGQVQGKIVRETITLVSGGLLIGVVAALALTRLAASMLYGMEATDPVTFGATVGALLLAATIAGYLPAWRASRLNPMSVLRSD